MATTIREYLVGIGFKVDHEGLRRFTGGLNLAGISVKAFALSVVGMATAVEESVRRTADKFESLYYLSQRTGVAASQLKISAFGFKQIGLDAERMQGQLAQVASNIRDNPALRNVATSIAPGWKNVDDIMKGVGKRYADLIKQHGEGTLALDVHARPLREYARMLGLDAEDMLQFAKNNEVRIKQEKELSYWLKNIGVDIEKDTFRATEFNHKFNLAWEKVKTTFEAFVVKSFPLFEGLLKRFSDWLSQDKNFKNWLADWEKWFADEKNIDEIWKKLEFGGNVLREIGKCVVMLAGLFKDLAKEIGIINALLLTMGVIWATKILGGMAFRAAVTGIATRLAAAVGIGAAGAAAGAGAGAAGAGAGAAGAAAGAGAGAGAAAAGGGAGAVAMVGAVIASAIAAFRANLGLKTPGVDESLGETEGIIEGALRFFGVKPKSEGGTAGATPEEKQRLDKESGPRPAAPEPTAPATPADPTAPAEPSDWRKRAIERRLKREREQREREAPKPGSGLDEVIRPGGTSKLPVSRVAHVIGVSGGGDEGEDYDLALFMMMGEWLKGSPGYSPIMQLADESISKIGDMLEILFPDASRMSGGDGAGGGGGGDGGGGGGGDATEDKPRRGGRFAGAGPDAKDREGGAGQIGEAGYEAISKAEGTFGRGAKGINYDLWQGYGKHGKASEMTLAQIAEVQKKHGEIPAAGAFQIQRSTLLRHAKTLGLDLNTTKFSPEIQQRLADEIRAKEGWTAWSGFKRHPQYRRQAEESFAAQRQAGAGSRDGGPAGREGGDMLPGGGKFSAGRVNLAGVNQALVSSVKMAASMMPAGWTVQATSGARSGRGGSQHHHGGALDMKLIGPDGKEVPNEGRDVTGMYTKFANNFYNSVAKLHPHLLSRAAWGGQFETRKGSGVPDLMHVDFGGPRGHFRTAPWRYINKQLQDRMGGGAGAGLPGDDGRDPDAIKRLGPGFGGVMKEFGANRAAIGSDAVKAWKDKHEAIRPAASDEETQQFGGRRPPMFDYKPLGQSRPLGAPEGGGQQQAASECTYNFNNNITVHGATDAQQTADLVDEKSQNQYRNALGYLKNNALV